MIVLFAGLPGTGKSTLAAALAQRFHAVVINKDVVRAALFPPALVEYSAQQDDFCQHLMLETAQYLIQRDADLYVFLDGRTFSRAYQRDSVSEFAARLGVPRKMIECVCEDDIALARIRADVAAGTHLAKNRTPELYYSLKASFESIEQPRLVIDSGKPLAACVDEAARFLV